MSARDLIQEALHSLEANKGRSLLTILGIVIGIASVIAMTSLIGGIQNGLINSLGLNAARMVQIYSSQELTESDIEKLQKLVPQIEQIGIVDSAYTEYKTGDKSYTVMAQGVDSDMLDAVGASKLVAGRTYSQAESQSGSRVALISRGGADQLYGNEQDALGKTIKVSSGEVQIVGVIDGGNDSMGSLTLYMPRETISGLFGDENPSFPSVTALAAEGTDMDELCKTIESKVRAMKGIAEDDEYDSAYAVRIFKARDEIFKILDMPEMSINEKLVVILKYCASIQEYINNDEYDALKEYVNTFGRSDIEHILMEMNDESESDEFDDVDVWECIRNIMYPYEDMEVLNTRWEQILAEMTETFHENMDNEQYQETKEEFMTAMLEREYEYRNFITYLVFRYFAKAVYDYDVVGKAKMFVTNYLILRQMDMLVWYRKHKRFTFEDRIDTVHIFSRQVEYSEDNMEALYESFLFDDVFETDNLCKLLWIDSTAL